VSPDRAAYLDLIAHLRSVMHEGRNLAVIEPFDREFEHLRPTKPWRGSDRVAALGAIAVWCCQPQHNVLTGPEQNRLWKMKEKALDARR
jgi:hypothetical protein